MDVAKEISKSLPERIVIAKVNGQLWDLERPLEGSCKLELLDFEHEEGGSRDCSKMSLVVLTSSSLRQEGFLALVRSRFG